MLWSLANTGRKTYASFGTMLQDVRPDAPIAIPASSLFVFSRNTVSGAAALSTSGSKTSYAGIAVLREKGCSEEVGHSRFKKKEEKGMRIAKYIYLIFLAVLIGICGMARVSILALAMCLMLTAYAGYVLGEE